MHRRGADDLAEDDPFGSADDADDAPRSTRRSRRAARKGSGPIRRWRSADEMDDELELPAPERRGLFGRRKWPVFWRARDSLYFEPLVALAIVVVLLVSLYAYTENWPPVYVVESNSMQHGSGDMLGLLNAGDIVLAEKLPANQIQPYFPAVNGGRTTYGEPGDVVIYHPNGDAGPTPVIHRALLYLAWNGSGGGSYDANGLAGLPCGAMSGSDFNYTSSSNHCQTTGLWGTLILYHVGWANLRLSIDLTSAQLGRHSGYLTLGDNASSNTETDQYEPGRTPTSSLVAPGWVIGVARGMIPWFGGVKLLFDGNAGNVPGGSWELLGLTVAGAILAAAGIHFVLRREGIESPLRRREEEEAEEVSESGPDEEVDASRFPRFARALRPWRHEAADEEDEELEARSKKTSHEQRRRSHFVSHQERAPTRRSTRRERDRDK